MPRRLSPLTLTVLLPCHAAFLPACRQNHGDCSTPFHAGVLFDPGLSRGPQVGLVGTTSVMVSWSTAAAGSGVVEYGTGVDLDSRAESPEPGTEHSVKLEGLTPDTRYHYQVVVEGQPLGEEHHFDTAPEDPAAPTRLVVIGDSGSGCKPQFDVAQGVLEADPDLVLHTGDVNYPTGSQRSLKQNFFIPYASLVDHIPFYTVLGNHDVKRRGGEPLIGALHLPRNNATDTEEFYSFDRANIHFVALDSNAPLEEGSEQRKWLEADLGGATASWKFVFFHHPPFSSSKHGSSMLMREALVPVLDRFHVDVVFNGHDHDYERTLPLRGAEVVGAEAVGAEVRRAEVGETPASDDFTDPQGTIYIVTGGGGKKLYPNGHSDFTAYSESSFHFVSVDVEGLHLELRAIRTDGTVMDQMTITKTQLEVDPRSQGEPESTRPPGADSVTQGEPYGGPAEPEPGSG